MGVLRNRTGLAGHRAIGVALLLSVSLMQVGPLRAAVEIWQQSDQFVRIEAQDVRSAPANDHPVDLSAGQIGSMLAAVQVRVEGDADPVALFSSEELDVLGKALAQGLARAKPGEDVAFRVTGTHGGRVIGSRLVNTGRVFYHDGRLNLIVGEVHASYQKKNVYGQRQTDFHSYRAASRAKPADGDWSFAPRPGVQRRVEDGQERRDWLLLDRSSDAAATAPAAPPPAAARPAPDSPKLVVAAGGDAEERLRALENLRAKNLISDDLYQAKQQEILAAATTAGGIEERLTLLKRLREGGLITEEVYRSRVEQIIDEL